MSNVVVEGSFDENRKWSMAIRAVGKSGNHIHTVIRDSQGRIVTDKTEDADAVWLSINDMSGSLFLVTASPDFSIPGGSKTLAVDSDTSMTLDWTSMASVNPPDPNAARSAKIRSKSRRR